MASMLGWSTPLGWGFVPGFIFFAQLQSTTTSHIQKFTFISSYKAQKLNSRVQGQMFDLQGPTSTHSWDCFVA